MKEFQKKYSKHQLYEQIQTRLKFLKYDATLNTNQKQKLIKQINDKCLKVIFNHPQPDEMGGEGFNDDESMSRSRSKSGGDEGGSDLDMEEVDNNRSGKKGKQTELDYDELFNKEQLMKKVFKDAMFNRNAMTALNMLPAGSEHDIDFRLFNSDAFYNYVISYPQKFTDVANIYFYEAIKKYLAEKYDK